jgi:hypothetical protein
LFIKRFAEFGLGGTTRSINYTKHDRHFGWGLSLHAFTFMRCQCVRPLSSRTRCDVQLLWRREHCSRRKVSPCIQFGNALPQTLLSRIYLTPKLITVRQHLRLTLRVLPFLFVDALSAFTFHFRTIAQGLGRTEF